VASVNNPHTKVEVTAASGTLFNSVGVNGLPIDQLDTWIIPAVRYAREAPVSETKNAEVQGYVSLIRDLVKSSIIYALSSAALPLVALVLTPFLAHSLSRTEYGALALLTTVIALASGVTQFGLSSSFFRAYNYDYESQLDRMRVISTVVVLLIILSIPVTIAAALMAPWLSQLLFGNSAFSSAIRLCALAVLMQNLAVPGFAWLRAERHAAGFSALSIANLIFNLGATLIFVGVLRMGIDGALLATGGGYAVVVACTLPVLILRAGLNLRRDIAWNVLSFGLPNVVNMMSIWVLQLSDRALLAHFGSLAQTASYSVAYSLGGVLGVVVLAPFQLAWPAIMFTIAKRADAARLFQLIFRWYSIVLLFTAYGLTLVGTFLLDVLFPPAYQSAAPIIPIIALSIMFYGAGNILGVGFGIKRKVWSAITFTTLAALVNVGLNLILIPLYGSMGAALSTLIAYAALALIRYIVNRRIYPVPFEMGIFLIATLAGTAIYIGSSLLSRPQGTYLAWGISLAALVVYGGCLASLGMFPTWSNRFRPTQTQEDSVS
jgi:O-antigen/teichoic acid export membrane protein